MEKLFGILLFLLLLLEGDCIRLVKKDSPAVIGAKVSRRSPHTNLLQRDRKRRKDRFSRTKRQDGTDSTFSVDLDNEISLYVIETEVGTPPQRIGLHIDTGSSDMWVNVPNSQLCRRYSRYCEQLGTYQIGDSSTSSFVSNNFNISYADGSGAQGAYVKDKVSVGDFTLQNLQFGLGNYSTNPGGILGIGYRVNEASLRYGRDQLYANLPTKLANRGLINSNAYSLWLNDLDASTGEILFGGVNRAKYRGQLHTLPILRTNGVHAAMLISLTDIGMNGNKGSISKNQPIPALLDSGTTLTYLPSSIARAIYSAFDTSYDEQAGAAPISCSVKERQGALLFTFSGVTIRVPINELVVDISYYGEQCVLGIAPLQGTYSILGDTFLRSAYVVYDLANNEISLAQTRFNATGDDIVEIAAGKNGVPDATNVRAASSSIRFAQTITAGGATTTATGNQFRSDNDSGAGNSSLSIMAWIMICVGLGFTTLRAF